MVLRFTLALLEVSTRNGGLSESAVLPECQSRGLHFFLHGAYNMDLELFFRFLTNQEKRRYPNDPSPVCIRLASPAM